MRSYYLFFCFYFILETISAQTNNNLLNVVFILVDDVGYKDFGRYGSSFYETPHIDALARDGMLFTNAYASAAVCSPTRASILTGKYPVRTGITDYIDENHVNQPENWEKNTTLLPPPNKEQLALSEVTIAEALKSNGYKTFFAGKWHLGGEGFFPENQGFDTNVGGNEWGHPQTYFSPYGNKKIEEKTKGEYLPERLTEEATRFIHINRLKPFFVYHSMFLVHTPFQAQQKFIEKYENKAKKLNITPYFGLEGEKARVRLNQSFPIYAAMIETLDKNVGAIVKQLKDDGIYDQTLIILTSDNGGLTTSNFWKEATSVAPLRAGKGWLYEGGIRVPLIIRFPGITKAGSVNPSLTTSPDFYPTILDATGISLMSEQHTDGKSLVPVLNGKIWKKRSLYWHFPQFSNLGGSPSSAVINGRWKLIEYYKAGKNEYELFNLKKDISEEYNLEYKYSAKTKALIKQLHHFLTETNALYPTRNPNYKPID